MAEQWSSVDDMCKDFTYLSDFRDDDDALEVNHNSWFNDNSDESEDTKFVDEDSCQVLPIKAPGPSTAEVLNRVTDEITAGMLQAGIIFEDDSYSSFYRKDPVVKSPTERDPCPTSPVPASNGIVNIPQEVNCSVPQLQTRAPVVQQHTKKRKKFGRTLLSVTEPTSFSASNVQGWAPMMPNEDFSVKQEQFPALRK